ncbi:MAG: 4Fe-4S dicluster domain-containing protein [Patescibacteria group bacterium]
MIRKIIQIDEDKCNGCGKCTVVCAEAALELVNGKAKVVGDFLCDGMGACLNVCDVDALHIVERETDEYDPKEAYERVKKLRGESAAKNVHGIGDVSTEPAAVSSQPLACGCPGTMMQDLRNKPDTGNDSGITDQKSQLGQWPIELRLLNPMAPYFKDADLVVAADCAPFAYANFHQKFLKGKALAIFCPKLDDDQNEYVDRLADIFTQNTINSITIVHMEVPCCSGIEHVVRQALEKSGKSIVLKDYTISISGSLI